jgi:hypothetical protein
MRWGNKILSILQLLGHYYSVYYLVTLTNEHNYILQPFMWPDIYHLMIQNELKLKPSIICKNNKLLEVHHVVGTYYESIKFKYIRGKWWYNEMFY